MTTQEANSVFFELDNIRDPHLEYLARQGVGYDDTSDEEAIVLESVGIDASTTLKSNMVVQIGNLVSDSLPIRKLESAAAKVGERITVRKLVGALGIIATAGAAAKAGQHIASSR